MLFNRKKPVELSSPPTHLDIPDGEDVLAAREKLREARAKVEAAEAQLQVLAEQARDADRRLADAARTRENAESALRRGALGEEIPKPSPQQIASYIEQHARAEHEAAQVRQRVATESAEVNAQLEKLRNQIGDLERNVEHLRFAQLVNAYREALRPAIPLAIALRKQAARLNKPCDNEPMLLNTDDEYSRQVFGVVI